jgi:hypothetical protein
MRTTTTIAGLALALAAGLIAPASARANTEPGCVEQFWMLGLRATTRIICDGPINADGGWMRARAFYAPAYVTNGYSNCYGGAYYSSCSYTPPRQVAEFDQRDYYPVTPTTVLPDEPGYVGTGTLA